MPLTPPQAWVALVTACHYELRVIIWPLISHGHHCYQDIKEYRGTLFMTLYLGMMPARLWRVTVVIVIKGAENGSGRYQISAISGPWLPGCLAPVTTVTSSQDSTSS